MLSIKRILPYKFRKNSLAKSTILTENVGQTKINWEKSLQQPGETKLNFLLIVSPALDQITTVYKLAFDRAE
jgi:hypothetical protein